MPSWPCSEEPHTSAVPRFLLISQGTTAPAVVEDCPMSSWANAARAKLQPPVFSVRAWRWMHVALALTFFFPLWPV